MSRIIKPGEPGFYINRKRYHEIESHAKVGVCGFFSGKAIKPGFGVVREFGQVVPSPNLLTNLGMNALGSDPEFTRMHLGTGTTPPDFTDEALTNFGVNVSTNNPAETPGVSGIAPHYGWRRLTWTSAVGAAAGNWTEIGISNQNTTGNLRSHALILDQSGNPTVFPVLPDEQFQGTYEFRFYAPSSDYAESVNMSGTPYDTTTRALRVNTSTATGGWASHPLSATSSPFALSTSNNASVVYSGGLAATDASSPLGSSLGNRTSVSTAGYTSDDHYLDVSARWGSGAGVGQIRTVMMSLNNGTLQIEYDPTINKLTTEEVIFNQRVHWARL